jgi:hypothetical protein
MVRGNTGFISRVEHDISRWAQWTETTRLAELTKIENARSNGI